MSEIRSSTQSAGMVLATVALVFATTGLAVAGPDALDRVITKSKVKKIANKAITTAAPGLSVAKAVTATTATTATKATDADNLGGAPAGAYAKNTLEAYHVIGAAGEPSFQNGWTNLGGAFATAAFLKDPLGIVHLRGLIKGTTATAAFTLPEGHRPAARLLAGTAVNGPNSGNVFINPDGTVTPHCTPAAACTVFTGLDGITFVAGR